MNATEKYWFVYNHPKLNPTECDNAFTVRFEFEPHMVCPETGRIEDHDFLNTKEEIWVEVMVPHYDDYNKTWCQAHDYKLDGGGNTWDEAMDDVYTNTIKEYGYYTEEEELAAFWAKFGIDPNEPHEPYVPPQRQDVFSRCISDSMMDIYKIEASRAKKYAKGLHDTLNRPGLTKEEISQIHELIEQEQSDFESATQSILTGADYDI